VGDGEVPRPNGERVVDTERWFDELRQWAALQRLPVDHVHLIARAFLMGRTDRPAIAAYLEQETDWQATPPPGSEQLELGL
jgi:hypothetical protein